MSALNIALFTWEYPPKIMGGLGTYTYELTKQLVKMEQNISVFTMNDGTLKTRELMNGIEVHRPELIDISNMLPEAITEEIRRWGPGIKSFSDVMLYNLLVSTKIVNDLIPLEKKQFNILSVHDWLSSMSGIVLKQSTNIPMVFHIHSTEKGRSLGDGSRIINELEHKAAQVADKIITVSHAMKEELTKLGFPKDKIQVCYNGVDPQKYSPDGVEVEQIKKLRAFYDVKDDELMILFVGRLVGVKGVDKLIMAMPHVLQKTPKAKLVIVGLGDLQEYLVNLVKATKMDSFVKFRFDFVPEEERILHYAACDVAVFPSLYEPFGIVALEAMSMERPVVVGGAGISGMREIVVCCGEEQCGYHVNPVNPEDIAWGINGALENPEKRKWLGRNGRRRVLSEFTWDKIAERTLEIYGPVLKRRL